MSKEITTAMTLEALEKSVVHWEEIEGVFAKGDAREERKRPEMGVDNCALCTVFFGGTDGETRCAGCPLKETGFGCLTCHGGINLHGAVEGATTNAEAYLASGKLLAKLRELRDEWAEKVEEERKQEEKAAKPKFKVGDRVRATPTAGMKSTCVKPGAIGVVLSIQTDGHPWVNFTGNNSGMDFEKYSCDLPWLELIPEPVIEVGDFVLTADGMYGHGEGWGIATMLHESKDGSAEVLRPVDHPNPLLYDAENGEILDHAKPAEVLAAIKFYREHGGAK